MEFSESFEFGNSTYKEIERQAADAVNDSIDTTNFAQPATKCKGLDVIPESPPLPGKEGCTSYNQSRINRLHGNSSRRITDRRKLSRSKSDSALSSDLPTHNGYSELFRSDLSFSKINLHTPHVSNVLNNTELNANNVGDTYLNVSQIEAAFKDVETNYEPAMVKPKLESNSQANYKTEIGFTTLNDDGHSSVVTRLSEKFQLEPKYEEVNDLHDLSSFMCLPEDNDSLRKEIIKKELQKSRTFIKEQHLNDESLDLYQKRIPKAAVSRLGTQLNKALELNATISPSCRLQKSDESLRHNLSSNLENLRSLSNWNLPEGVLKEYQRKGVQQMFKWQVECLAQEKILFEHRNLVYSAPTSAGKTLVSELLLLKTVLEREKKGLLILPFISVVREKMLYLQDLFQYTGYRVEGFFGGYTPAGGFSTTNVAICTIEKANSIVNKLMEQGKLDELGIVVVDEIHLISDPGRGYILELLLAKVLYMSAKYSLDIQIVTMSATLSNVQLLKQWLDAELYVTDFRPVALKEMIKIGQKIYDNKMQLIRYIKQHSTAVEEAFPDIAKDADHVAQLCAETIREGCSVIIFCPSKDWCESLSVQLSEVFHTLIRRGGPWGDGLKAQFQRPAIEKVKGQLRDSPAGLDSVLEKTLTLGIAFHHAGLTSEERDVIETGFKAGALKVIVATSTLSSGVNLPARRVIIRSPMFGGKPMNTLTYRQMIGRAGRTGKDTLGESILICSETNARIGKDIVTADLKPINSCLQFDSNTHLKRALLEVISAGVANTKDDLDKFLNCTLLYAQKQYEQNKENAEAAGSDSEQTVDLDASALDFLIEYEFIRLHKNTDNEEEHYIATKLGMACLSASIPPTDGLMLLAELQKSRRCFVLESELHAVYLVTPYSVCFQLQDLDWLVFLDLWEKLPPAMKKVAEFVGVKESFIVRGMRGQTKLDFKLTQIHKRFYTALALQELVNEVPINAVARKYKCPRGLLQSLQQTSSTFAGIVTCFCNALHWTTLSLIVGQFKERLYFGISRDLIDLMRLADLSHKRARILFNAGITTITELANADVLQIENILHNELSFDSHKQNEEESEYEAAERQKARICLITGKADVTIAEAARILIQQARQYVQYEIGVAAINWSQDKEANRATQNASALSSSLSSSQIRIEAEESLLTKNEESAKELEESEGTRKRKQPNMMKSYTPGIHIATCNADGLELRKSNSKEEPAPKACLSPEKINSESKGSSGSLGNCLSEEVTKEFPKAHDLSSFNFNSQLAKALSNADQILHENREIGSKINIEGETLQVESALESSKKLSIPSDLSSNMEMSDMSEAENSLMKNPKHLNNSYVLKCPGDNTSGYKSIEIVDICANEVLFETAFKELMAVKRLAMCLAIEKRRVTRQQTIGGNVLNCRGRVSANTRIQNDCNEDVDVDDLDIDFAIGDSNYLDGIAFCISDSTAFYLKMQTKTKDQIKSDIKSRYLKLLLESPDHTFLMFDAKEQLKIFLNILKAGGGKDTWKVRASFQDPKVANWLMRPDKVSSLNKLVDQFAPQCKSLLQLYGSDGIYSSIGLEAGSPLAAKFRSAIEACVTVHVIEAQMLKLQKVNNGQLYKFYQELEMPLQLSLGYMECHGFPIDSDALYELNHQLLDAMKKLETQIYELHGARFNLHSAATVGKILGIQRKSDGSISTSKQILERIDSPLAQKIVNYRKIASILSKTVQPLLRCIQNNRIHVVSITFTSTGRISMTEPNLQNVAKDFHIDLKEGKSLISCRSVFSPPAKCQLCLLSSDFCQLEMRILAHLSQDETLQQVMLSDVDIFSAIAARWNKLPIEAVTELMRNNTKQICYGIIYGVGMRTLAENLKCSESEGLLVSEQFHAAYPGIRLYADKVIKFARSKGFVETITGRRRYLEHINSEDNSKRKQSERQAINSAIQGSAADIAKTAILRMEKNILKYHKKLGLLPDAINLVLHVHDELIYEVPEEKAKRFAKILSLTMENCVKLSVPLKVKLKIGPSWGEMKEMHL